MAKEQAARTECPHCKEEIRADAVLCKHCGARLGARVPEHGGVCPYCKEAIHPEATRCKHCRSDLEAREASGCGCAFPAERQYIGALRPMMRDRLGGQCYDRCRLYCGGDPFYCDALCRYICEGQYKAE